MNKVHENFLPKHCSGFSESSGFFDQQSLNLKCRVDEENLEIIQLENWEIKWTQSLLEHTEILTYTESVKNTY